MACSIVFRSLTVPVVAALVLLGPPLGAGCGSDEQGLEVRVQAAPLPAEMRSFTTDLGYQVTITQAAVSLAAVELQACPQARRWWPPGGSGVARAHSTASPTRLAQSFVLGLSGGVLPVGTLGPPPGGTAGCGRR